MAGVTLFVLAVLAGVAFGIWEARHEEQTLDEIQQAHRESDAQIQQLIDRRRR